MAKKPHQETTPQEQQTLVPKKPGSANKTRNNDKREARLAEALRANLRRRKSRGAQSGAPGEAEQDEREE